MRTGGVFKSRKLPAEIDAETKSFHHWVFRQGGKERVFEMNNYTTSLLITLNKAFPDTLDTFCLLSERIVERGKKFGPFLDVNVHHIVDAVVENMLETDERKAFCAATSAQSFAKNDFPSVWLRYRWTVIGALLAGNEHAVKELATVDYYALALSGSTHSTPDVSDLYELSVLISDYIKERTDVPMTWWLNLHGWGQ